MELDEEGQHALPDLQDLCHQLRGGARWDPTCGGALGPDNLGGFSVAAVNDFLELPSALRYKAEHLSFTQVLKKSTSKKNIFLRLGWAIYECTTIYRLHFWISLYCGRKFLMAA